MDGPNDGLKETLESIESDAIREMWREIFFDILGDVSRTLKESDHGTGEIEFTVREESYQDTDWDTDKSGVLVMETPFDVPWDEFDVEGGE